MMQLLLNQYSKTIPKNKFVVFITDHAGWHRCHDLKIPSNTFLLFLHPYSPQLNPIEQVWQQLKQRWLSNRSFRDYNHILEVAAHAWNTFTSIPGAIKKLCSRSWDFLQC